MNEKKNIERNHGKGDEEMRNIFMLVEGNLGNSKKFPKNLIASTIFH